MMLEVQIVMCCLEASHECCLEARMTFCLFARFTSCESVTRLSDLQVPQRCSAAL